MTTRVLYLTEWYPHRHDAMSGLFVRKHAIAAVRQGADICVLYLYHENPADRCDSPSEVAPIQIVEQQTDGVHEVYVYYTCNYLRALQVGWHRVRSTWGMPDVCQLNVITKNALLPLWLRLRYHIPYIIVEHWTGYLPISPTYKQSGRLHQRMAETVTRNAYITMPVSQDLLHAMQNCGLQCQRWKVLNNVVDDFFYNHPKKARSNDAINILHISCFDEPHKNVCGLLRAIKTVSATHNAITLTLVGAGPDYQAVRQYADTLNLPDGLLRWTGELPPEQVAEQFDQADMFVLFSNYENAPVVVSESLAAGVPIVSSAVGGIAEMVPPQCGILVPARDEQALAQAILQIISHLNDYNRQTIREYGNVYSYQTVGKQLMEIHESARYT